MEIMTPQEESRIAALVLESARARAAGLVASGGRITNYVPPERLSGLGRLAEPALARVGTISKNPEIRSEAKLLLRWLASNKRKPQTGG
jgi:hypothetical protein